MDKGSTWTSTLASSVTSRKQLLVQMPRVGSQGRMSPRPGAQADKPNPIFSLGYLNTATLPSWVCHLRASRQEHTPANLNHPRSKVKTSQPLLISRGQGPLPSRLNYFAGTKLKVQWEEDTQVPTGR